MAKYIDFSNNKSNTYLRPSYKAQLAASSAASLAATTTNETQNNGGFWDGLGYLGEKVGLGFLSGVEGIWDFAAGGIADLFGADEWAEEQFANDWVNYNHADEWYNPSGIMKTAGDIAGGIGSSLPSLIGTAAGAAAIYFSGGAAAPVATKLIAASLAPTIGGLAAAGNATKEAYRETGNLTGKEYGYGFASGVTEAGLELVTQGIGTGTGRITKAMLGKAGGTVAKEGAETAFKSSVKSTAKTVARTLGKDFLSEGFEEGFAEAVSPIYKRLTYDPDAQFASFDEIMYSSFVGGMSGLVMGGTYSGISTTSDIISGNNTVKDGKVTSVTELSRQLFESQTSEDADIDTYKDVRDIYSKLTESIKSTNGEVTNVAQKKMLGELKRANTRAMFMPFVERSAQAILADAEGVAQRYSELGMTDANGKALSFTAEQIRSGIDMNADTKTQLKQLREALSTNSVLSTLAIADAAGRIMMDTKRFEATAARGAQIASQWDLNYFVEHASEARKQALGEALGIEDWNMITHEQFTAAVGEATARGKTAALARNAQRIRAAKNAVQDAEAVPTSIDGHTSDGLYRFMSESGDINMALIKEGDAYFIYDYDSKNISGENISRQLSRSEVNKILSDYHKQTAQRTQSVNVTAEQATESRNAQKENSADVSEQSGDERYSLSKSFAEQIDDVLQGKHNPRLDLYISQTPAVLTELNFTEGPLLMRNGKIKEILDKHPEMSAELLKKIPEAINDPVLILKSKTHPTESVVIISDILTDKGEMIVPVWINQEGNYIDVDLGEVVSKTNFVASAYGRDVRALLKHANENDGFLYQNPDEKRVKNLIARSGLQLSTPLRISNSTISISQTESKSNTFEEKSSETSEKETRSAETIEIDAFARENIPDYAKLSEPNRQAIRMTIRQARAHGFSEQLVLSAARVSARSGLNVVFDATIAGNDAKLSGNTIYIDPNASKKRIESRLLLHEGGHALMRLKGGKKLIAQASRKIDSKRRKEIIDRYTKRYEEMGVSEKQYKPILEEEIAAAYIEDTLGDINAWDYILSKEPTFSEKFLSFFRKAAKDYSMDENLSSEARKLLRTYKKLFNELSARNQGNNALGSALESRNARKEDLTRINSEKVQDTEDRQALPEETRTRDKYSYNALTSKDELIITTLPNEIPLSNDGNINRKAVLAKGKLNARKQKNPRNTDTETYVYVDDIGVDVLLGTKGMQHGLVRSEETALAITKIGDILKNSVAVNELNGSKTRKNEMSYVLLGACQTNENLCMVRSVVSKLLNDVTEIDIYQLSAVKGKKTETPNSALKRGAAVTEQSSLISSESLTISITDFLHIVKDLTIANEILSEDVLKKLGVTRSKGTLSESVRFALPEDTTEDSLYDMQDEIGIYSESEVNELLKAERASARDKYREQYTKRQIKKDTTEQRNILRRKISRLNQRLLHPTKEKNIPYSMQAAIAEALANINLDTVGIEQLAELESDITKLKKADIPDADRISKLEYKREKLEDKVLKVKEYLEALHKAYKSFEKSNDPTLQNAYSVEIASKMEELREKIGDTSIKNMDLSQIEATKDFIDMLLTQANNANKLFKLKKQETLAEVGNHVISEISDAHAPNLFAVSKNAPKVSEGVHKYAWQMLKPLELYDVLGSPTLYEACMELHRGADLTIATQSEAVSYFRDQAEKYGYFDWNLKETHEFNSANGKTVKLSLEDVMSIYAYSKREGALGHLRNGGFVFEENAKVVSKNADDKGLKLERIRNDAERYTLDEVHLLKITSSLTAEQRAFIDNLQDYLSSVLGEKGNEVSLKLYGIKLFKEKFYWPMVSAKDYLDSETGKTGDPKIKNKGMTKELVPDAGNPLVLRGATDVFFSHISDMSLYYGMVLPMEDMNKLLNYRPSVSPDADAVLDGENTNNQEQNSLSETKLYVSLKENIRKKYGNEPIKYIEQLLRDLNGGIRSGDPTGLIDKGLRIFKKGATSMSLSVAIQQPSSIVRAMSMINPKYFADTPRLDRSGAIKEEMSKYAPVFIIKQMGGFDTGMGKSLKDYATAREYKNLSKVKGLLTDSNYRDSAFGVLPAKMDEITWVQIWEAVKREQKAENPSMKYESKEFLEKVGARFSEIIYRTQVYDSVLSRNGMMRSKDTGNKMVTAFMAEPLTAANMLISGYVAASRGNKSAFRAACGAFVAANIVNSALAAFVYAMRDDDEEKSYWEKWLTSFTERGIDGLLVWNLMPWMKDIWSLFQGYDVERADMSSVSDLINAGRKLFKKDVDYNDYLNFAGYAGNMLGIPLYNIKRDVSGIVRTMSSWFAGGEKTTGRGMKYAFVEGLPLFGKKIVNQQQLYDSLTSGDTKHYDRVRSRYESNDAADTALRTALRDNDVRISQAAKAKMSGDMTTYNSIIKEISSEGNFSKVFVTRAVTSEYLALRREIEESGETAVFVDDVMIELSNEQKELIGKTRTEFESKVSTLPSHSLYRRLTEEQRETAINYAEDLIDDATEASALGIDRGTNAFLAGIIGINETAILYALTKGLESDKDESGKTVSGSKRKKVVSAINSLGLSGEKKLLLICAKGYSLQDGDIRGLSAANAKKRLLRYILSLPGKTKEEKARIAEMCGFEVRNGRIITKSI